MARPINSWKMGGIDVAAWDGKTGPTFSIRKSYKDKVSGQWVDSKYFYVDDLKKLASLLEQAIAWGYNAPEETAEFEVSPRSAAAAGPLKETVQSILNEEDIPF